MTKAALDQRIEYFVLLAELKPKYMARVGEYFQDALTQYQCGKDVLGLMVLIRHARRFERKRGTGSKVYKHLVGFRHKGDTFTRPQSEKTPEAVAQAREDIEEKNTLKRIDPLS